MTISTQSPGSLLDSVLIAQSTRQDIGAAVLKKAQDTATQEGQAVVEMLDQTGPKAVGSLLDTYA
jgi:Putative motility protein